MPDKILFACVKNGGRSVMCERLFNAHADAAQAIAVSAGSDPAGNAHPVVVDVLREEGIDASDHEPQKLTPELAAGCILLVTMGCGEACPYVSGLERQDWPLADPKHMGPVEARKVLESAKQRVLGLIQERGWSKS